MHRPLTTFLVLSVALLACSSFSVAVPTATPVVSATIEATQTLVPQPTDTVVPTSSLAFDSDNIATLVVLDGFTISIPIPLVHQVNGNIVLIADEEKTVNISFAGDQYNGIQPLNEVIDSYLASLEKRGGQFQKGAPVDVQIDGITGITVALTGTFGNMQMEGEAVAVSPRSDFVLFGLGLSKTDTDIDSWKNKGQTIFHELLSGIKFTDTGATCPISSDKTYGYKQENPIKVGGGDFEGPSRERAYLDHLRGPNGDELSYKREGSLLSGETILDAYQVTGSGIDVVIYVDEYNFSEPAAPVGFTCEGAFPLSSP